GTVNGTFKAHAGGEGAAGGSLSLSNSAGQITLANEVATPASGLSVMAPSVAKGGFNRVSLTTAQGLILDDGLDFSLDGELLISAAYLTNNGSGGSAHIKARRLQMSSDLSSSPAPAMASGGSLVLEAPLIEMARTTTIRGFADTRLVATDLTFGW